MTFIQAKSIAKQKAEQLNERLNYMPSELLPGVETETELQYFEEELEINDFPQQIRYRICSRVQAFLPPFCDWLNSPFIKFFFFFVLLTEVIPQKMM